jgi:cytochrome c-type biogenesis protein CcmI
VVIWLAAILLIAAVALFVSAPLSDLETTGTGPAIDEESGRRAHEHAIAIQALRELEFDHAMGKLDSSDYAVLRERLERRALAAMAGWEKPPGPPSPVPVVTIPPSSAPVAATPWITAKFCSQCGTKTEQMHNSCPHCGAPFAATAAS